MSQGKGDKRRPCRVPSWLEVIRWKRAIEHGYMKEDARRELKRDFLLNPEDGNYLTDEERDLINV
jgi:hypothetical protein